MVNITIDKKQYKVPDGITVLRAAQENDIHIPTLCDHPNLTPYGGCRLCMVEVDGMRTLQPSCTLPVSNNMVVRTNTEKIQAAREFILTLIFSERNHFCQFCVVSGGDCELQNAAYDEEMNYWPIQPNWQKFEVDASHEYFVLDHNRCILCRRCVRACADVVGNYTLAFEERGENSCLIADLGTPLGDSSCISCGTCVQVCPTGAIIDRWSAYRGRETEVEVTRSVCIGCSVGCGINVLTRDNHLVRIESDWDAPVNNGLICKVGRFFPMEEERERVITPLIKKNGALKAATWEEAYSTIVENIKPLVGKNGSGIAALASTRLPIEALYTFRQLFSDHFGSDMVTSIEEGVPTSIPAIFAEEAKTTFEGNLNGLLNADCVVAIGVNLIDNHEVAGFFVKRIHANGTKLIVIDPVENPMDVLTEHTLKGEKGHDADILDGLRAALYKQKLVKGKPDFDVDKVLASTAKNSVIDKEDLLAAANAIGSSNNPFFVYGKGLFKNDNDHALKAMIDLAKISNKQDNNSNILSMKGQANSVAASQLQLDKRFELNGHKAVYLAIGDDEPSERLIKKVEGANFSVVQSTFISKLTANADVVLPVENWDEHEGHYINLEGRVQKVNKALQSPEDVKSNVEILETVAKKLGAKMKNNWQKVVTERPSAVSIEN